MLYTGKGDKGDTGVFGCDQRISKSSAVAEALGVLDECNSFLGICKMKLQSDFKNEENISSKAIEGIQQDLFIIQAEIAGADKKISADRVINVETVISDIEKDLPEIKSFSVPGGTELSAHFDFARTLVRRAERRAVAVAQEGKQKVNENTLAYLNRLSSLLFALARLINHKSGITEEPPRY